MTAPPDPFAPTASERLRGRLMVLAAAVLWSTSGFFAKAPLFAQWPLEHRGLHLAFWRALFACLFVIPLVRRPRWHVGLVPMVLIFAAMNYTYLTAMTRTTAANAIWLQNVAPVWVFLVGVFVFGERIEPGDWVLVLCGAAGVGFIVLFEARGEQLMGVIFGVLSGLTFAGVVLSVRQLRGVDAAWLIALNLAVTAVLLSPVVVADDLWPTGRQFVYLTAFGMLQLGLPYYLFARGVRWIAGHEASGIALLEPILVPVWVFLAWHAEPTYQPPQWWTYVGGCLILTGLLWRFVGVRRLQRRHA
jgi:drug/metabolite transporter, DME family